MNMKRVFRSLLLAAVSCLALVASVAPASAATLTKSFNISNGNILDISSYRKIALVSGYLNVTTMAGNFNSTDFPDAGGVVLAKIVASSGFAASWQLYNGVYYNVDHTTKVFCNVSETTIVWGSAGNETITGDGCQVWQAIKANSN